jgi:hypothetical protein
MSIVDPLPGKIREILQKGKGELKKIEAARQRHLILGGITLALSLGLFFSALSDNRAYAEKNESSQPVSEAAIDPFNRIDKGISTVTEKEKVKKTCERTDPVIKLDTEFNKKFREAIGSRPMAEMVPFLSKLNRQTAAFLVAIAKKESDLGVHTPKKNGRECFNFWGYRGKEDTTESGYSCFASPEQAVEIVGNRIESLLDKKIDTPSKMVVWKCGRDCEAAGGQAAANKWIMDVAGLYNKLQS